MFGKGYSDPLVRGCEPPLSCDDVWSAAQNICRFLIRDTGNGWYRPHSIELVCVSTGLRTHQDVHTIQLLLKSQSKRWKRGASLSQESLRLFDLTLRRSARFVAVLHEF